MDIRCNFFGVISYNFFGVISFKFFWGDISPNLLRLSVAILMGFAFGIF